VFREYLSEPAAFDPVPTAPSKRAASVRSNGKKPATARARKPVSPHP